jgi:hypothetical protein
MLQRDGVDRGVAVKGRDFQRKKDGLLLIFEGKILKIEAGISLRDHRIPALCPEDVTNFENPSKGQ